MKGLVFSDITPSKHKGIGASVKRGQKSIIKGKRDKVYDWKIWQVHARKPIGK